ncbi:hypothetical protein [uncultured Psychroserpens sp.]|uniref:hypothetical protein n=1 Tax=uncultured Psychroserpens sp. TaxID=255436 RepID=UPI00262DC9D4|nr:hypothetical protein [uncultured Psychroserpens sp.]
MILVFNKVGAERLPIQIGRLLFQGFLIFFIWEFKSRTALFILVAFHLITALLNGFLSNYKTSFHTIVAVYHLSLALVMYFNNYLQKLFAKTNDH